MTSLEPRRAARRGAPPRRTAPHSTQPRGATPSRAEARRAEARRAQARGTELRTAYGREVRPVTEMYAYRLRYSRIWLADVLPVLLKYRAIQAGRDLRAEWYALLDAAGERIDAWLDRHGF